jgi:hypothetical protein
VLHEACTILKAVGATQLADRSHPANPFFSLDRVISPMPPSPHPEEKRVTFDANSPDVAPIPPTPFIPADTPSDTSASELNSKRSNRSGDRDRRPSRRKSSPPQSETSGSTVDLPPRFDERGRPVEGYRREPMNPVTEKLEAKINSWVNGRRK